MASIRQKVALGALTGLLLTTTATAGERYYRYDDHYSYRGYNNHHYYDRHHHHKHRHHKKHNGDGKLIAGLLVGALVGYAIFDSQRQPQQQPAQRYDEPRYVPRVEQLSGPVEQCLQTREYQARVTINGEEVDAYGTACLQPDGSWKKGPLTVSQYDSRF